MEKIIPSLNSLKNELQVSALPEFAAARARFFKTGKGEYGEGCQFLGIYTPTLQKLARIYAHLALADIKTLLTCQFHEERLIALYILKRQYLSASHAQKNIIYAFYMDNLTYINNWDLVDTSAPGILGEYLHNKDKDILLQLAKSDTVWHRRIAIVATLYFIRTREYSWTIKIAALLLNDRHDLIHKAVGWLLREVGKKDRAVLVTFLDRYVKQMPRTMLRYALEHFPKDTRAAYLNR